MCSPTGAVVVMSSRCLLFGFVELPALLLLVLAMVVYGVGLARERIKPPVVAWSLIAGGTLPIPVSLYLVTYVPHGILLTVLAALSVALTDVTITSTAQARPLNPLHLNASIPRPRRHPRRFYRTTHCWLRPLGRRVTFAAESSWCFHGFHAARLHAGRCAAR
jgi:hypothetical protein